MVSVKFFAEDKNNKQKTSSNIVYFDNIDNTVLDLIELNREKILISNPNARVIALITNEGDQNDQLFV